MYEECTSNKLGYKYAQETCASWIFGAAYYYYSSSLFVTFAFAAAFAFAVATIP